MWDTFSQKVCCPEGARKAHRSANMTLESNHGQEDPIIHGTEPGHVSPRIQTFRDFGLNEALCTACETLGYHRPTPIQLLAIPKAMDGHDIIGLAQTGSGKTMAFVLPILHSLMAKPAPLQSLILAPTRELAEQTCRVIDTVGSSIAVRTALLIGGMDMVSQTIALARKPHVVIATPGRLLDHLQNTKGFSMRRLKYLVLDESDRLLDLDFDKELDKILTILPKRTTFLFSATSTRRLESLQRAALTNPVWLSVPSDQRTVATLQQHYCFIPLRFKDVHLIHILNERTGRTMIVFTRTVNEAQRLATMLRYLGFSALSMHGQLSQTARIAALSKLRAGTTKILIATDVAARGLDVPAVDVVINYDLPQDSDTYIHRVGRTARAGRSGVALSLVTQYDYEVYMRIEKALGFKLTELVIPREEALAFADAVSEASRKTVRDMRDAPIDKRGGRWRRGTQKRAREDDADLDER
ncbi:hypothetical protein ANO11243_003900 [Dothideomycetidae sp. 11243]|nr:hypothetical protein ANO11243_003900 [fungal sp. No.11243]